jgi:hypothetical protein
VGWLAAGGKPDAPLPPAARSVVQAHAAAGRFAEARAVAGRIDALPARLDALLDVADARARRGGEAAALPDLAEVEAEARAAAAAAEAAVAQAEPSPPLGAKAFVAADLDRVLRRVVVLQVAAGRPDLAAATLATIRTPFHAATACTEVARDLLP